MPELTASTRAASKAAYLARQIREREDEIQTIKSALREAIDAWAVELSSLKVGDRVTVLGVPQWNAQVTEVRSAAGAFEETHERPVVVVTVRYLRKDGELGAKVAAFYDGYNRDWKLSVDGGAARPTTTVGASDT